MMKFLLETWPFLNNAICEFGFNGDKYILTWFTLLVIYVSIGVVYGFALFARQTIRRNFVEHVFRDDYKHTTFGYLFIVIYRVMVCIIVGILSITICAILWPFLFVGEIQDIKKHGTVLVPNNKE